MHDKYYNPQTKTVLTWKELSSPSEYFAHGLGLDDDDFVRSKGWYPYREESHAFDETLQELVPEQIPVELNGEYVLNYVPVMLPIEVQQKNIQERFTQKIQQRLDDFAKTRNYDNIMSVATYATSTNPKFAAEGQYAVEARDNTWSKGYAVMADVLEGKRPLPTWEELELELPVLEWPS